MPSSPKTRFGPASSSGLGREFSFKYRAHRVIVAITVIMGGLAGLVALLAGEGLGAALVSGLNAGAAAFVAWVLARELDPPRQWSGWLAAVLAGLAAIAWGPLALVPSGLFVLLLRVVNRSAGGRIRRVERLVVLAASLFALLWAGNGWLGIAAAMAFLLDGAFSDRAENLALAGLAFSASLVHWWQVGWPVFVLPGQPAVLLAGLAVALFFLWLWCLPRRDLGPDDRDADFNRRRLLAAVTLALAISLLAAFSSPNGWLDLAALWAALLAALILG